MSSRAYCIGIDTSNYTTSAAMVDEELNIIGDSRRILNVKKGERGLRQSQALFEHVGNLPEVIGELIGAAGVSSEYVKAVAVSERPRPVEGSYMPVFKAGISLGRSLSAVSGAAYYGFSHQEGHIEAALHSSGYDGEGDFLALHLSGGTTEVLKCRPARKSEGASDSRRYEIEIVGATADISLGQLIDRVGTALGIKFPCGREMDRAAAAGFERNPSKAELKRFCRIKTKDGMMNISGIETQIQRYIEGALSGSSPEDDIPGALIEDISAALFFRIGEALKDVISQCRERTGLETVIMSGGVASSEYIRRVFEKDVNIFFGRTELSSDNAVGTALMGMKEYLETEVR